MQYELHINNAYCATFDQQGFDKLTAWNIVQPIEGVPGGIELIEDRMFTASDIRELFVLAL